MVAGRLLCKAHCSRHEQACIAPLVSLEEHAIPRGPLLTGTAPFGCRSAPLVLSPLSHHYGA